MQEETLPWMIVARSLIGTREFGQGSNPIIMQWAELMETPGYTSDSVPWCGLWVAYCMFAVGLEPVKDPLWARNWGKFGTKLDAPAYGSIMVFSRGNGGHVGFYVGEDQNNFHLLGGNQSDMVNVAGIAKNRLLAIRWPDRFLARMNPGEVDSGLDVSRGTES